MTIRCDTIDEMTEVVAGLVRQGLTFESRPQGSGWLITLTGGY